MFTLFVCRTRTLSARHVRATQTETHTHTGGHRCG